MEAAGEGDEAILGLQEGGKVWRELGENGRIVDRGP
jgi:hypothetical protein